MRATGQPSDGGWRDHRTYRLAMGYGAYLDDRARSVDALEVAFLRSPLAHGRIEELALPGEHGNARPGDPGAVPRTHWLTPADVEEIGRLPDATGAPQPSQITWPVLANGIVKYAGEPVVAVAAQDRYRAEDLIGDVRARFGSLPSVAALDRIASGAASGSENSGRPSAAVHQECPDNVVGSVVQEFGDLAAARASSPRSVRFDLRIERGGGHSIEPRGILATPLPDGRLHVLAATQSPNFLRAGLTTLLRHRIDDVVVEAPADIGGSFGPKGLLYPEDVAVCLLALATGRPVLWIEDRREHFLSAVAERTTAAAVEVGHDDQGHLTYLDVEGVQDIGAYAVWGTKIAMNTAMHIPGPHRLPAFRARFTCRYSNRTPVAPVRGGGRPQGVFIMDRAIEAVARATGLDPVEVHRRNLLPPRTSSYASGLRWPGGQELRYRPGDSTELLERVIELAGPAPEPLSPTGVVGFGLSACVERSGAGPGERPEQASLELTRKGLIVGYTGMVAQGQGHDQSFRELVAHLLGLERDQVEIKTSSTARDGGSLGTFGSRGANIGAGSFRAACVALVAELRRRAAEVWACDLAEIGYRAGRLVREATGMSLTVAALCDSMSAPGPHNGEGDGEGDEIVLRVDGIYHKDHDSVGEACCGAWVEVDRVTQRITPRLLALVHDAGAIVDERRVRAQVVGGMVHGLGNALLERLPYDEGNQPRATTFLDYALPSSAVVPEIRLESRGIRLLETDPRAALEGADAWPVCGVGELGALPVPSAVAAAVEDALGLLEILTVLPIDEGGLPASPTSGG